MKVRYVPRLAIPPEALERVGQPPVLEGPDPTRVIDVDEDEATMAVEAVRALLAATGTSMDDVAGINIGDVREAHLAEIVGQALLGDASRASTDRDAFAERDDAVVHVRLDPVRPGSTRLFEGASAFADAWLGPDEPGEATTFEPTDPVTIDAETALRLGGAEEEATKAVPMGAYVSDATWARSRDVRYRLFVGVCHEGHHHFPPQPRCPSCGADAAHTPAPSRGRVYSYTVISAGGGPSEFDFIQRAWGSYASLAVEPAGMEDVRIPGILGDTPVEPLRIGLPVDAVFRRLYGMQGAWRYGIKWRASRE